MSEETLDNLFAQARQEVPETSTAEVLKWIGGGTLLMMIAAYLTKFKIILISKPLVMISSFITVAGITAGTIALLPASEKPAAAKNTIQHYKSDKEKKSENFYAGDSVLTGNPEAFSNPLKTGAPIPAHEQASPLLPFLSSLSFKAQFCTPEKGASPLIYSEPQKVTAGDYDKIGEFHAVEISGFAQVFFIQEDQYAVRLDAADDDYQKVDIKNVNGVLKIHLDEAALIKGANTTIYVSAKSIDKIKCSDVVEFSTQGTLELNTLLVESTGATQISLHTNLKQLTLKLEEACELDLIVNAENISMDLQGASTVNAEGEVSVLNLIAGEAATLRANALKAETATVNASGASSTKIHVKSQLDINVDEAAKVTYKGTPRMGTVTVAEAAHLGRF